MKATIESTHEVVELNGVDTRLWRGETDDGVPILVLVARVSPQTRDPDQLWNFNQALDRHAQRVKTDQRD